MLTDKEFKAVQAVVKDYARWSREDVIGAILRTSGHRYVDGAALVRLAHKLEGRIEAAEGEGGDT